MKQLGRDFMTRFFSSPKFLLIVAVSSLFTTSCRKSYSGIPINELTNSAPFKATVENIAVNNHEDTDIGTVAVVGLKTADGRLVAIGGQKASEEMIGFVKSLQKGQTYTFPDVFLDYLKSIEKKK
jgi:hypothetical protein